MTTSRDFAPRREVSPPRVQRLLDNLLTRTQSLPTATSRYTIEREVRIPTRDGIDLLADVYTPTSTPVGLLLNRAPYGYPPALAAMSGGLYASRGYRVVLARCRGTFGSGGDFVPMIHEVDDAADTVEWLRRQTWFDGRFATFGGSYHAFTQWALLMDPPPELIASAMSVGPHDFHAAIYHGGAFNLIDFLTWSHTVVNQETGGFVRRMLGSLAAQRKLEQTARELPLVRASETVLDNQASWYAPWASRRDASDPAWAPLQLGEALERVTVPVLLQAGWHDLFLPQMLEQYARLSDRGVNVALTIGPWTHGQAGLNNVSLCESIDWLDGHFAAERSPVRNKPVKISITGVAGGWRDLSAWPPPAEEISLYPCSGAQLSETPALNGTYAQFTYDPTDPTPTIGGRILTHAGSRNDSVLAERADVLSFTGPPLGSDVEVIGIPRVEVAHSTDNPHSDLFVRISEVDQRGRSKNISDGFQRLDPTTSASPIHIGLDAIAHRFAAGNRIRLSIAGGSHPRWERNLGTGENPATSTALAISHRTIDLASTRLILPIPEEN